MAAPTVLILTEEFDLTADCVVKVLNEMAVRVFRYDTSYFPANSTLSYESAPIGWSTELIDNKYDQRSVDLENVTSVWYRRPTAFRPDGSLSATHREFVMRESAHAFGGVLLGIPALWVNRPDLEARADYKPLQLRMAHQIGLLIPETLITNEPGKVRSFYDKFDGSIIYKALGSGLIEEPGGWPGGLLTTRMISLSDELLARVRYAPCIFQKYVDKAFDLRVTIIGSSITSVRIDTGPVSATDWRGQIEGEISYSGYDLPGDIADKLLTLMNLLGLEYGAVDMAVTNDLEHYFLEVNPSGQFAWLDDEVPGIQLSERMAKYLSAGLG
ncbi:MAG TPA: ATP-dependent carboxylate-amine ligase [Nonomuraea sp.]|nr:ATP-dependent carboxylate-amine ligase [Nonomuraea sp.]